MIGTILLAAGVVVGLALVGGVYGDTRDSKYAWDGALGALLGAGLALAVLCAIPLAGRLT